MLERQALEVSNAAGEVSEQWQLMLASDLQVALNLIRQYQRALVMLGVNDPNWIECRNLLTKYGMSFENPEGRTGGQVFVDGHDITVHPDSVPGTAVEVSDDQLELVPDTSETTYSSGQWDKIVARAEELDPGPRKWTPRS